MDPTTEIVWASLLGLILSFIVYTYIRYGYRVYMMPLVFWFLAPVIFFPFGFDAKNFFSVGEYYSSITGSLHKAWFLYALAAVCFFVGIFISMSHRSKGAAGKTASAVQRAVETTIANDVILVSLTTACVCMFLFLVSKGLRYGSGINLAFDSPEIRPIANISNALVSIVLMINYLSFAAKKSILRAVLCGLVTIIAFANGQRGLALIPIVYVFIIWMASHRRRNIILPVLLAIVAIIAADSMAKARVKIQDRGGVHFDVVDSYKYGNNFSDIRDFAWIIQGWKGDLLLGKTYLSGYTPFIPSYISDFRTRWGWGRWSSSTAGLNPRKHGGLRGGLFSEAYFNFGLIPMALIAFGTGIFYGSVAKAENYFYSVGALYSRYAAGVTSFAMTSILFNVVFSGGFFIALIYAAVILAGLIVYRTQSGLRERNIEAVERSTMGHARSVK